MVASLGSSHRPPSCPHPPDNRRIRAGMGLMGLAMFTLFAVAAWQIIRFLLECSAAWTIGAMIVFGFALGLVLLVWGAMDEGYEPRGPAGPHDNVED